MQGGRGAGGKVACSCAHGQGCMQLLCEDLYSAVQPESLLFRTVHP